MHHKTHATLTTPPRHARLLDLNPYADEEKFTHIRVLNTKQIGFFEEQGLCS